MKSCTQDRCQQGRFPCPCSVECESDEDTLLKDYAEAAKDMIIGFTAALVLVCALAAALWGLM